MKAIAGPALLVLVLALTPPALGQPSLVGIPDGPNGALPGDPLNQDRAVFSVATFKDSLGRDWIYFAAQNERLLLNIRRADGSWVYSTSVVVLEGPAGSTAGIGAVFSSDTAIYTNARDGFKYKYLMYMGYQLADAGHAGGACVSFSNNGINWTVPIAMLKSASEPVADCSSGSNVKLEAHSAYHATPTEIHYFGLEGDLDILRNNVGTGKTLTHFYKTFTSAPHVLSFKGNVSANGMFRPTIPGGTETSYFINMDVTYDPVTGKLYLFRVYPYPYRATSTGPSDPNNIPCSGVCPVGLATYPMRGQIYWMQTNGDIFKAGYGTWTLLADGGGATGWSARSCPTCACVAYPLIDSRQIVIGPTGFDLDSLSVKKNRNGTLFRAPNNQMTTYFGGWEDRQNSCDTHSHGFDTFLDGKLYTVNVFLP